MGATDPCVNREKRARARRLRVSENASLRAMALLRARLAMESAAQLCFLGTMVQAHDHPAPASLARARSATRCAKSSRILPCSAQNLMSMGQSPLMCTLPPDPS